MKSRWKVDSDIHGPIPSLHAECHAEGPSKNRNLKGEDDSPNLEHDPSIQLRPSSWLSLDLLFAGTALAFTRVA